MHHNINLVEQVFQDSIITPVVEGVALEHVWRSMFPEKTFLVRPNKLVSANLSHFMEFVSSPTGINGNSWGDGALRLYPTVTGSCYKYNVHVDSGKASLGHHVIFAPTGGGKTTMTLHTIAGAMRYAGFKAYIFDRKYGCEIFTKAVGGQHIDINNNLNINPFTLPATNENKSLLLNFVTMLAGLDSTTQPIRTFINKMMRCDVKKRSLRMAENALITNDDESLIKLREFASGIHSHWFNGVDKNGFAYDALDLSSADLVTFEMDQIMDNPDVCAPMLYYVIRRIISQSSKNKVPHWIFIDEASSLLRNKMFRSETRIMLEQIRKNNGVVSLAFQNPATLRNLGDNDKEREELKTTILGNTATKLIFPFGMQAKKDQFADLSLTDEEFDFVRNGVINAKPQDRYVLVKKPNESVILNIGLGYLGNYLKLYASDSEARLLANKLQQQGDKLWVEEYMHSA